MSITAVDVLGIGHCCVDYLCLLEPYPEKGLKGIVKESLVIDGGPVPTALKTVVKFGGSARFCGKVGADEDGVKLAEGLRAGRVQADTLIVDPQVKTARAYIWIDPKDGSRTVALDISRFEWFTADQIQDDWLDYCRVLLTDGRASEASLKALTAARKRGVTTVLDAGSVRPRLEEMLPLVDYALVSRDLADTWAPQSNPADLARRLALSGVGTAVVTVGHRGAVWQSGNETGRVPGFLVKVLDTTGAGDVYHGAFIYGLLQNWQRDYTLRFAAAASALACRKLSGTKGIPELEEVFRLME